MSANRFDFRCKNGWGHALHGGTMRERKPSGLVQKLKDWLHGAYRVSFMIHHPKKPKPGDWLIWKTAKGEVHAPIYQVRACGDPEDMYEVFVRVADDCRHNPS